MTESKYEERAENIMPKWSCWGDGLVRIKRVYWYQSRIRIIAILKQLHRAKKRMKEIEAERKRYKDCLEFLVLSHANSRVKMECIELTLKGE